MRVDGEVIVQGEVRAFVVGKDGFRSVSIFVPTAVLQGSDVEERVWPRGIVLGHIIGIESGPAIPNFLQGGFVGKGWRGLFGSSPLRLRKAGESQHQQAERNGEKAFHA